MEGKELGGLYLGVDPGLNTGLVLCSQHDQRLSVVEHKTIISLHAEDVRIFLAPHRARLTAIVCEKSIHFAKCVKIHDRAKTVAQEMGLPFIDISCWYTGSLREKILNLPSGLHYNTMELRSLNIHEFDAFVVVFAHLYAWIFTHPPYKKY